MKYEKIIVYEKNCMLFWNEHKDDIECMHYGRSRYVNVVNENGASSTTKVMVKQLHYMPITPTVKRLYLSEETAKHMRWHKEGKRGSKDPDIMSHPADDEAWEALDRFDPEFVRDLGVSVLACQWMVSIKMSNLTQKSLVTPSCI
jgi:hypothetical protein